MRRRWPLIAAAAALLLVGVGMLTLGGNRAGSPGVDAHPTRGVTPTGTTTNGTTTNGVPSTIASSGSLSPAATCGPQWDCAQQRRFDAALALITAQRGHLTVEVRDRRTGAVWRGGEPSFRIWAGSTPKLAFAVALLEQARAGQLTLDVTAQRQIAAMLAVSDNQAADALWDRYANSTAMMARFNQVYGMKTAGYVTGFPRRWGFVKCTSTDLASLMSYILTTLNPTDRQYVVNAMRHVGGPQQWGVWGAGATWQPGVKDGWSIEKDDGKDHWITATVGFVGPDERYVVAAMYHQLPGGDSVDHGVHVLTDLVATLFGAPVPAPAIVPPAD